MPDRTREDQLVALVRDLHRTLARAGLRVEISHRDDVDLYRELTRREEGS